MRDAERADSCLGPRDCRCLHLFFPMWFTQRMHQPVRPAEDGDGMDEIENFKIIQTDFPQVIKLVDPHIVWMGGQIDTEIEQRLLEIRKVRIQPVLVYFVHDLGPFLQLDITVGVNSGAVNAVIDEGCRQRADLAPTA